MSGGRTRVRIGEVTREVSLEHRGEVLLARVDGREYRLSALEPQSGVYSFVQAEGGGRSTEVILSEVDGAFRVRVRDRCYEASVERPGRDASRGTGGHGEGRSVLRSVMPGRVVRILVETGGRVKRGQGILVLEAMKMENEVGSPKDGVVAEVRVAPGQRVETGAPLAVIE